MQQHCGQEQEYASGGTQLLQRFPVRKLHAAGSLLLDYPQLREWEVSGGVGSHSPTRINRFGQRRLIFQAAFEIIGDFPTHVRLPLNS
jgi:hypothetical protein